MNVKVLESTNDAEKLMCVAARGDYMSDWNGEKSFEEIMSTVSHNDGHLEKSRENNYYPKESDKTEAKMISFIEKQLSRGHYGPAEHPQITFAVKGVSRVTMAQITRHRHITFDIQSMRYADFSDAEPIVPKSVTDPEHQTRREGLVWYDMESDVPLDEQEPDVESMEEAQQLYERAVENAVTAYQAMQEKGVPDEDARYALPLGTPVNMTFSGNARTFMHLLDMRKKANAQWEIHELSEKLIDELMEWMPYSYEHYDRNAPHKLAP